MARTLVANQQLPLSNGAPSYYPAVPLSATTALLTESAGDVSNGNYTPITDGKTILIAHNTDTGAQTITLATVADSLNRKADITTYSIAAGKIVAFGPFKTVGWAQSSPAGLWINVSDTTVKLIPIQLP